MATLSLLLPDLTTLSGVGPTARAPALAMLLGRGRARARSPAGLWAGISGLFDVHPPGLAAAPLTRLLDANDAPTAGWLRADPAHVRADPVSARLLACGNLGLGEDDTESLARALRPMFGDDGFEFSTPRPDRWYLRLPREARLPRFSPPEEALGADLAAHLPADDLGRRWRRLLNEAQVILHNHPVNAARAAHGLPAVNSLWFWGAGVLPDWARTALDAVVTDEPVLTGLARFAGVRSQPVESAPAALALGARLLVDLRTVHRVDSLEVGWLEPLLRALRARKLDAMELRAMDGRRVVATPGDLWRIWRRPHSPW
jgi:hypothetical protein